MYDMCDYAKQTEQIPVRGIPDTRSSSHSHPGWFFLEHVMKKCNRCHKTKLLGRFSKDRSRKDGLQAKCKSCEREIKREKRWSLRNRRTKKTVKRKLQPATEKRRANKKLYYAVKTGKVIKPEKCQRCNKKDKLHGHHPDYNKPLEVVWLCTMCHGREHWKEDVA